MTSVHLQQQVNAMTTETWTWHPVAADRIVLRRKTEAGTESGAVIWFGGNTALRDAVLSDHQLAEWVREHGSPA